MARVKLIPRRTIADVITPQQWAHRFRTYYWHSNSTFAEFLAGFATLWDEAKNYVTDYEASWCLINQLPMGWRVWAETEMGEFVFKDSITGALRCHFRNLMRRLSDEWTIYGKTPRAAILSAVDYHGNDVAVLHPPQNVCKLGTSNNFVLPLEPNTDPVVVLPKTREVARKRTHDGHGSALDVCARGKRHQHALLIRQYEDLDGN